MRWRAILLGVVVVLMPVLGVEPSPGLGAAELSSLNVVVVSAAADAGRGAALAAWLRPLVASLRIVAYRPGEVLAAPLLAGDVVVLDWAPQISTADGLAALAARTPMPLGARAAWHTPTVLLGAAGLLAADAWRVAGGVGSLSLQPFAYALRHDHPLWAGPLAIATSRTITIAAPAAFAADLTATSISVLPLVAGTPGRQWPAGWCAAADDLGTLPDIECLCGGLNGQAATAMAVWRQGDLMHVGFQQLPPELNDAGRALLANAIAYIADFHADRPIAIQGAGGGAQVRLLPREAVQRQLLQQAAAGAFTAQLLEQFAPGERLLLAPLVHDPPGLARYCRERLPYLHPDQVFGRLTLDDELRSRSIAYDSPAFLDLVLKALRYDPETGYVLLERYVPEFPRAHASVVQSAWLSANRPYLFASDAAGYRWSVDPLAQARGVPSATLHGPARRDVVPGAGSAKP